ncbi:MAG: hypothetical protein EOO75_17750 [Myxococcales bacterium]|nr:MAG: hypothetical protein EOO75_17750 [Myxococcales bacterium]
MRFLALLPLLTLSLTGCPTPYAGQARVSPPRAAGDVGGYVVLGAYLDPEATMHTGAPRVVDLTDARCVDESLCEVTLRGGLAVVGGKKEGEGDVRLSFVQPNGGESTVQVVRVRFSPRPVQGFALGPHRDPDPRTALVLEPPAPDGGPTRYRCYLGRPPAQLDAGDLTRGEAHVHTCTPGVEVAPGRWYLPSGDGLTPPQAAASAAPSPRRLVCQHMVTRTGVLTSLVVYRDDGPAGLTPLSSEGEPGPVCAPRK